jgi:hypothetical protein
MKYYLVVEIEGFTALSAIVADLHAHPSVGKIHLVDDDRVENLRIFALGEDPRATVTIDSAFTRNKD